MSGIKNIIAKELSRVFSDKKLMFSLFILPALMIVLMYSLMGKLMSNMINDIEEHIPTVYIQNAPEELKNVLNEVDFKAEITYLNIEQPLEEGKANVLSGELDLIVTFGNDFGQWITNYKEVGDPIPEIKTYYNPGEDYSQAARDNFVNTVLKDYEQKIVAERIGNMEILHAFDIDLDPKSSAITNEKKAEAKGLAMMVPFLVNIMLFSGAMGLVVDAITGEKERGTLASVLLSPVKRGELVFGKIVSLGILAIISAAVYVVTIIIAVPMMMKGTATVDSPMAGFSMSFTALDVIELFVIMIFLVYLYVAIISLVSVIAKSVKEANTYVMPAYIVIMIGSMMTMYSTGSDKALKFYLIPVYNTSVCMQNILMGELTLARFLATVGTTFALGAILTMLITKAFNNEKIMFNA